MNIVVQVENSGQDLSENNFASVTIVSGRWEVQGNSMEWENIMFNLATNGKVNQTFPSCLYRMLGHLYKQVKPINYESKKTEQHSRMEKGNFT